MATKDPIKAGPRRDGDVRSAPLSSPVFIPVGNKEIETQFRVLSDSDCADLQRKAQIYISKLYAEDSGEELAPGKPSAWLDTSDGQEQVWREYRRRLVLESCVYEHGEAGKGWSFTLDEVQCRANMSNDQIEYISDAIQAYRAEHNPETWTPEMVVAIIEDAKKNSPELISYGAQNLAITITTLVDRLPRYMMNSLCISILNDSPLDLSTPGLFSEDGSLSSPASTGEESQGLLSLLLEELGPDGSAAILDKLHENAQEAPQEPADGAEAPPEGEG